MSDHTITACCLNMEALLREAVGLLPAEPDWKVRVIAELNRPPATPAAPPPGAGDGPYVAGTNCAGETAAQVANYILADLRVLFKGNQSGQSLCDAIGSAIVGALKESSAAGAASRDPEINRLTTERDGSCRAWITVDEGNTALTARVKTLEKERDHARADELRATQNADRLTTENFALAERVKVLKALLKEARGFVEDDARMSADITRHAPLSPEEQARHDSTPALSELLLPRIDAALNPPAKGIAVTTDQ